MMNAINHTQNFKKKKVIYIDLYSVVLSCTYLTSVIRAVDYANMYK